MLKEETIMLGCAIVITGVAVVMISNANTVREETELLSAKIHGLNSGVRLVTDHLVQLRAEIKEGNRILNSLLDAEIKKKMSIDVMSGAQLNKVPKTTKVELERTRERIRKTPEREHPEPDRDREISRDR